MILVGGLDYWTIKQKALNGSRSKLTPDQLEFVGVELEQQDEPDRGGWSSSTIRSHIDEQLEELDRLKDMAPGWYALARRILENEKSK